MYIMKALLLQFFWVCILFFGEISGRFNSDNGTVCRVSTALSTAWFTVGVYISKHYEDIVGCAFLEGWVGARSDQNELNTQSFIVRGPQPDVYQAYEMALFYFVNVLFMAGKKFSNNVLVFWIWDVFKELDCSLSVCEMAIFCVCCFRYNFLVGLYFCGTGGEEVGVGCVWDRREENLTVMISSRIRNTFSLFHVLVMELGWNRKLLTEWTS